VLNGRAQLDAWRRTAALHGRRLPAAIQIDSGMPRLGLSPAELEAVAANPASLDGLDVTLVMSHPACADEPDHPANAAQLACFEKARCKLPAAPASLANSSGIFLGPAFHFDLVRPGAALYGVNPTPASPNPMRRVVRLQGKVIQTREVPAGAGVGYGYSWIAPAPTLIAAVSVGYADDYLAASVAADRRGSATPSFRSSGGCRWTRSPSTSERRRRARSARDRSSTCWRPATASMR
jgi:alanine racemase